MVSADDWLTAWISFSSLDRPAPVRAAEVGPVVLTLLGTRALALGLALRLLADSGSGSVGGSAARLPAGLRAPLADVGGEP